MTMSTKKRIKQLLEEILIEMDLQRMNIERKNMSLFEEGEFYGFIEAGHIVARIGNKYLKEEGETK